MEVRDRDLGGRHQVQVVAGDDVHLVFLVGDLAGAAGRVAVDDDRRPDLGHAVLAGVDVEEPVDQRALEPRPGALVDREAGAGDLRAARQVDDVERLGDLPVGLPAPGRAAGGRVRADLALERLLDGELLAPRPDGDVRLLAADRDVGVGGVRDAEEEVLDLGLDVASSVSIAAIRSPASTERRRSSATSGPSGFAPPLIASPISFDAAFRSALSASPSPSSAPAALVGRERLVDDRRILALVDRALADRVRVLAQPLQPDAHAGTSHGAADASRRRSTTNPAIEAREQPAGARAVRPAEEREVERRERASFGIEPGLRRRRRRSRSATRRRRAGRSASTRSARAAR